MVSIHGLLPWPSVSAPWVWGQLFWKLYYEKICDPFGLYFGIWFQARIWTFCTNDLLLLSNFSW